MEQLSCFFPQLEFNVNERGKNAQQHDVYGSDKNCQQLVGLIFQRFSNVPIFVENPSTRTSTLIINLVIQLGYWVEEFHTEL